MPIKTLFVGINAYEQQPLRGCLNDVAQMRDLLTQRYGVSDDRMRTLTDSAATSAAITDGLRWLAQPDDGEINPVRLLHYSGHGVQIPDENGDEEDGCDECIVPYDYNSAGFMTDDTLREIYAGFAPDGHLLLVMDSCHSGGSQRDIANDFVYRFLKGSMEGERELNQAILAAKKRNQQQREDFVNRELFIKDPGQLVDIRKRADKLRRMYEKQHWGQDAIKGNTVLLAASRPEQCAADARFGDVFHGALTYYLVEALASGGQPTYASLHDQVVAAMGNTQRFTQVPQLECEDTWRDQLFLRDPVS